MSGFTEALDATTERYLTHFGKTAVALKAICDEAEIPLDASGVNAVAFTTYKATKDAYHAPAPQPTTASAHRPALPPGPANGGTRELKLENAGDEAYLLITAIEKLPPKNFGATYQFTGTTHDGESVYLKVGEAAVERQLAFLGVQATDLIGKTVQFSRAPNPKGKPFWNIAVKGAMKGKKAAPPSDDFGEPPVAPEPFDLF